MSNPQELPNNYVLIIEHEKFNVIKQKWKSLTGYTHIKFSNNNGKHQLYGIKK
jgi:hypothetical protein